MKILTNEKVFKVCISLLLMVALVLGCMGNKYATETEVKDQTENKEEKISVLYNTHIQNEGWEKDFSKKDGQMSGTSGKSYRLEAIKIKLEDVEGISIKYQTHIQNVGWQNWKKDGEMSGTSGQSLRLEGIKIKLENTEKYSVMYRVHVQNIGWQDWKCDGEMAGTSGQSLRLEAIEIKIVEKSTKFLLNIDTDLNNTIFDKNGIHIEGWKLSTESNTKLKVYIDNKEIDEKNIKYSYKYALTSIVKGYGTAKENPEPNFDINIPTIDINTGIHKIEIRFITSSNEILEKIIKNVRVDKSVKSIINIDTALQNVIFDCEKMHVEGWILATEPNTKLEVFVDDKQINEKFIRYSYKYALTSIVKGYGTAKENPNPNFDIDIPLNILSDGKHKFKIKFITSEGILLKEVENDIIVDNTFFRMHIESIFDRNTITNETHTLSGWLMTNSNNQTIKLMVDGEYQNNKFKRIERQDVLNYFDNAYQEQNTTPGFSTDIDFSKLSIGLHQIALRVFDENDNKIGEKVIYVFLRRKITYEEGIYGKSAYAKIGDSRGSYLKYYRYGDGPNVFFATFSLHGFEDNWDHDGEELTYIANKFYETLKNNNSEDYGLANKWTIYILPTVNPDGQKYGYTNNGPGRTTMYSLAPNNKGIDLNRCWKYSGFNANESSRNYIGTEPFQAYEAQYLRDFLQSHKSQKGQTILVDLHGWLQQLIGDRQIGMYYAVQFPENNGDALDRYGDGYLINWARTALASNGKLAKTSLIELPEGAYNHQAVVNKRFAERYIQATLSMLNGII